METEEVIKLVDGIYKNILEKFNPGARQLISAGKAYLKALHGAAAASRLFNEALAKIAVNAQQGGTADIGSALINIVGVYKEIQDQQMNILKAFYVDLLVPLETNLEKDTKVVQFEQKKFLQQHKVRADSYSKAAATMKKQRKKKNNSAQASEKEIKSIQALDEEKNKLDVFCEQSLKNAMTQERRRYGFVLERQCSLAKHWMAYHSAGSKSIENHLDGWGEVAATREFLPPNVENMFARKMREIINDDDSDRGSISSVLRKTKSIDASCLDMRSLGDVINSAAHIPRAKSEFNLNTSTPNEHTNWDQRPKARSLYAYLSSGENQLSFLEGDRIALVGDRAKGWQFGENLRTQMFGWFPLAYTEMETDENSESNWDQKAPTILHTHISRNEHRGGSSTPDSSLEGTLVDDPIHNSTINSYHDDSSPTRLFGDTIVYRQSKQFRHVSGGGINNGNGGVPKPGPPPTLPAPVPTPVVPNYSRNHHISQSHSFSSAGGPPIVEKRKSGPATTNFTKQVGANKHKTGRNGVTNASLHSSNDSGFANEPPPQPEVDYSDEETVSRVPIRNSRKEKKTMSVQNLSHNASRSSQRFSKAESPERHVKDEDIKESRESTNRHSYNQKMGTLGNNNSRSNGTTNQNIRQSTSFGNLTDENTIDFLLQGPERRGNLIKRTKSFWRFGKSDDILEGMALWKHRDLVQLESEKNEQDRLIEKTKIVNGDSNGNGIEKQSKRKHRSESGETTQLISESTNGNNAVEEQLNGSKYHLTKTEIDHRINKHNENIYGLPQNGVKKSSKSREINGNGRPKEESNRKSFRKSYNEADSDQDEEEPQRTKKYQSNGKSKNNKLKYYNSQEIIENQKMLADDDSSIANNELMQDMNFFDDDSVNHLMLKTVKRQEILKQYYSSGTDTERHSSSSDPYDCIVVDDHLVRKENERRHDTNRRSKDQHNTRERDSNKMEFTTFRGNDEMSMKEKTSTMSTKIETPRSGTLLPRTKLAKTSSVGPIMQTVMKMDKEQQESRDNDTTQRRTKRSHAASNNTNVNNGKAYGPWYDLWGRDASVQN